MPWCNVCRRNHLGSYGKNGVHCFKCNKIGYYAHECRREVLREQSMQGTNAPRNGRFGRPINLVRSTIVHSKVSRVTLQAQGTSVRQVKLAKNV